MLTQRFSSFYRSSFVLSQRHFVDGPNKYYSDIKDSLDIGSSKDPLFHTETEGKIGTKDYRIIIIQTNVETLAKSRASPLFTIPLRSNDVPGALHMVCEVPKGTNEKMNVNPYDPDHGIVHDVTTKGKLCYYEHGPILWNYGMLPQTLELKDKICKRTKLKGDGDPLDIIDIGDTTLCAGEVIKIYPLGALPLIDQGEIDWKIIGINIKHELAPLLHDIHDVKSVYPGMLDEIKEWFRIYKVAEGKEVNTFALDGEYQNKETARDIINESYENPFDILPDLIEDIEKRRSEHEQTGMKRKRPGAPPTLF